MKKIIIIALVLAIVAGFLFWKFGPSFKSQGPSGPVELTYWGLWEEDNLIKPLIAEYQKQNPKVKINYVRQSSINYRTRVQAQITEGIGPDIFRIHNSWLPMFTGYLYPAPDGIFSTLDYNQIFYPVAQESFIKDKQIFSAPIEVDGLSLYYNEEILASGGVQPPKNWQEFAEAAVKLTVRDSTGQIKTAGASLGTAGNVDHWSDILGLLLLQQPNVNFEAVASSPVAEVFRFYTGFVTDPSKKSWDVTLPRSTDMFASGRLAFYFAPSWRAHELRVTNPNLKFKVVPVPQLPGRQVSWASFWGEAVSVKSKFPEEAWKFIKFLTSSEVERFFYQEASKIRLFGEPYSRQDLAGELSSDPIVGAYVLQGPNYKFWYLSGNTFDNGLNDEMIKYFEDGINATLQGIDPQVALQTVDKGVQQTLEKFTKKAGAD